MHYDHVDMHKITPTIEEVIALTKWLTDKQFSTKFAKSEFWLCSHLWTLETFVSSDPKFMKICKLVDHGIRNKLYFGNGD
jgi:hypothetical protein